MPRRSQTADPLAFAAHRKYTAMMQYNMQLIPSMVLGSVGSDLAARRRPRGFVTSLLLATGLLCLANSAATLGNDEQPAFSQTTYAFKTIDDVTIEADVYRHEDTVKRPVIVWLHGGALIIGSRSGVPQQLKDLASEHGFVIVSLDYRLAPEAQLAAIIEDLTDGLIWVRESGPELYDADSSRLVVAGASAGGYLALMSGFTIDPPPTAIVSYWGFGDLRGDWTTEPNAAYLKGNLIEEEVAWAGVGAEVLTSTNQENGRGRATFFMYLKQTGNWTKAVSGFDPETEAEELEPFCPIQNLSEDYPPTLFLHGTADNDVPVGQSIEMAAALESMGVSNESIIIEGGGHGLWGGDQELILQAFERSTEFIREHLTESTPAQ